MEVDIERFRALARSSPWLWSTLRYVRLQHSIGSETVPVRVLVRRPKLARLEDLNGTLLRVLREQPQTVTPLSRWGRVRPIALPGATDVDIEVDEGGLVRRRPERWKCDTDTAMIGSYYDVALLDPVELADGNDGGPGAVIDEVGVVDHHGRKAWEAVLRPTASYDPRCSCCALLLSETIEENGIDLRAGDPDFVYPDAYRVRLDVGTGVCVFNEQLGGGRAGFGHDIAIEAVDEPMGDDLFVQPARSRWAHMVRRP